LIGVCCAGNYKIAHGILFDTYKDLESRRIKIPNELKQNLMLLHSYVLAKVRILLGGVFAR